MCFAPLARSHLLPVGGGNGGRFVNRPYARNQSCACRAGACSRRGVRCKLTAGAKFSEFGHPFVCFADISPIRGITPPYHRNSISCVGNGLDRSVNLPIYWGGGTRKARDGGANHIKIYGRPGRPPLRLDKQTPICHPAR